jgi:hypothetical protein
MSMALQDFLLEIKNENQEEFKRIDDLLKVLDDLTQPEVVTMTYSITSGNQ